MKTLEAFAMGVPVVSTRIGAEGIAARDGEHLLVEDTPPAFAEKVLWLLDHPDLGKEMACRARACVKEHYDWRSITENFEKYLQDIVGMKSNANHAL